MSKRWIELEDGRIYDSELEEVYPPFCPIGLPFPWALNSCNGCWTPCCPYSEEYDPDE